MKLMIFLFSIFFSTMSFGQQKIELNETNSVVLREDFNSLSIGKLIGDLAALDTDTPSDEPIYLVLITPGGYIVDGLTLYTVAAGMNRPVHTITIFAASMGFQTVQNLGKRYIVPYGILMSHKAAGGFRGEFGGKTSQIESRYGLWLSIINQLDNKTVERTNGKKTLEQYQAEYDNELWMLGSQAVESGYADELILAGCSANLSRQTETVQIAFNFLKLKAEISKCPLDSTVRKVNVEIPTSDGYMGLEEYISKGGLVTSICGLTTTPTGENKFDGEKQLCIQHPKIMSILQDVQSKVNNGKLNLIELYRQNTIPMTLYSEQDSFLIYKR